MKETEWMIKLQISFLYGKIGEVHQRDSSMPIGINFP